MSEENPASINFRNASCWPRSATIGWWPGTRIFTWVVAAATCRALGGDPVPPVVESGTRRVPRLASYRFLASWPRLPRRPAHPPPTEQVEMQVEHALAGIGTDVRHEAPAGLGDALRVRRAGSRPARRRPAGRRAAPRCPRSSARAPSGSAGCAWAPADSCRGTPRADRTPGRCRRGSPAPRSGRTGTSCPFASRRAHVTPILIHGRYSGRRSAARSGAVATRHPRHGARPAAPATSAPPSTGRAA